MGDGLVGFLYFLNENALVVFLFFKKFSKVLDFSILFVLQYMR